MDTLKSRFIIVCVIFGVICFSIVLKLYVISVVRHSYYHKLAAENAIKTEIIVPVRGQIIDRNGEPLAINELGFEVAIKTMLKENELEEELDFITLHISDVDKDKMRDKYKKLNSLYRRSPIVVIGFVPYAYMQRVHMALLQRDNIKVLPVTKRLYPNNASASHVIGYIGASDKNDEKKDPVTKYTKIIGKQGLEKQYNKFLQGELGYTKIQVNHLNQQLRVIESAHTTSNNNVKVSLDMRLQETLDGIFEGKNGAGIVMDARNGEILASGSYPEYDINDFVGGISNTAYNELLENPYKPLINKITNGLYPPGSVIKMGMGLTFLEYSGITERTIIDTPYDIVIGGRRFRSWKYGGHGKSDLIKALKESVDVYFYKLSQTAGINNIAHVMRTLGFGDKTNVDLPHESRGVVPDPEWKMKSYGDRWYAGDTVVTSIGQGSFLVTPIQIARYTALIANGKLVVPHYAKELGEEKIMPKAEDVLNDFQKSKLKYLKQGMYQTCSSPGGTGYFATMDSKIRLACKTGTAQVVGIPQDVIKRKNEDFMAYFHRSQAWVTAFLPYENPQYVITLLVEHGAGGSKAAKLLVELSNKLLELGYINSTHVTTQVASSHRTG